MGEYRKGSVLKGALGGAITAFLYVALPVLAIRAISLFQGQTDMGGLTDLLSRSIEMSPVLIVISFFCWFYPKGNRGRVASAVAYAVAYAAWLVFVLGDAQSLAVSSESGMLMSIGVSLTGLIVLLIAFRLLKLAVVYGDHRDHRREYLEETFGDAGEPEETGGMVRIRGRFE